MVFARENTSAELFAEMWPLIEQHYQEIARFQDIDLDPNFEIYSQVDQVGKLRLFTVRNEFNRLVGYACFFVAPHLHFKNSLQATHDLLFIERSSRGEGMKFIKYCDEQLKLEGVEVVSYGVSQKFDWSPILERMGYEQIDTVYARQL